jgi:hypothetical protein
MVLFNLSTFCTKCLRHTNVHTHRYYVVVPSSENVSSDKIISVSTGTVSLKQFRFVSTEEVPFSGKNQVLLQCVFV